MNRYRLIFPPLRVWLSVALALVAAAAPPADAQQARNFPADSYQVRLDAIADPVIEVSGTNVQMSGAVLIFGSNSGMLTRSALTAGSMLRIEFDASCQVKKIWVLGDDEIVHVPFWIRMLEGAFQPPCSG